MASNAPFKVGTRVKPVNSAPLGPVPLRLGTVIEVLRSAVNERAVRVQWDEGGEQLCITADLKRTRW